MKKILNKFLTLISLAILIVISITMYNIAFATEENSSENLDNVQNVETQDMTSAIRKTFTHSGQNVTDIQSLINKLNSKTGYDGNYYHYKYGVYAGLGQDRKFSSGEYLLSTHLSLFCLDHWQGIPYYKDTKNTTTPYSWTSTETNMKTFSTEGGANSYNTNLFIFATVFSNKSEYTNENPGAMEYGYEAAQQAIWAETGSWRTWYDYSEKDLEWSLCKLEDEETEFKSMNIYKAAKALDEFEKEKNAKGSPVVSAGTNAGTVLLGDNEDNYQYKIGPFNMSDYAYAYSSHVSTVYNNQSSGTFIDGLIGGITAGRIILSDDNGNEIIINEGEFQIEYKSRGDSGRKGSYYTSPINYNYPYPNSEFYIIVDKDKCGDSTTLSNIEFTYQYTTTSGNGWICEATYVDKETGLSVYAQPILAVKDAKVEINEDIRISSPVDSVRLTTDITIDKYITKVEHQNGDVAYENENGRANEETYNKRLAPVQVERGDKVTFKIVLKNNQKRAAIVKIRDIFTGANFWCDLADFDNGIIIPPSGTKEITATVIADEEEGIGSNTALIITRNQGNTETTSNITNSIAYIRGLNTNGKYGSVVNLAELNGGKLEDSDYYEIKTYDVSIDKYITQVTRASGGLVYDDKTNNRKNLEDSVKRANPVYVEVGDTVKYRINITNNSNAEVDLDIKDILPENCTEVEFSVDGSPFLFGKDHIQDNILTVSPVTKIVEVSLTVTEHDRNKIEENTAVVLVNNVNGYEVTNISNQTESSDYYKINDYNISINKYISSYTAYGAIENNKNEFTAEGNEGTSRVQMTETQKADRPLHVDKGDSVTYTIRVANDSVTEEKDLPSGIKKATSIKTQDLIIQESFDAGIEIDSVTAKLYNKDGRSRFDSMDLSLKATDYSYEIQNNTNAILAPGEYIEYYVTCKITQSNMYLNKILNQAIVSDFKNVNDEVVQNGELDNNISSQKVSSDYVIMKDLVVAGTVWLDSNKNGLKDTENGLKDIIVKLYSVGTEANGSDTLVRTTKTDQNGLYTFSKDENGNWYSPEGYSYTGPSVTINQQRIPKATNKDANYNYTEESKYIQYYIEYEYDGLIYKSTDVYSGKNNLNDDGTFKNDNYKIDSNAAELKSARDNFNEKYEIIAFNKAYDEGLENVQNLEYEKDGHTSKLKPNNARKVISRSFINTDDQTTDYLWLYKQTTNPQLPETEYLKYINLGLVEREGVDLELVQDVYEVKTTVNGEEMTYEYNQNDFALGNTSIDKKQEGNMTGQYNAENYATGYIDEDTIYQPYCFKPYNSDYYYKSSQYSSDVVKAYKGTESELNVETTFRIKVNNKATENKEKVYVGINEIVEYYDTEFVDLEFNEDGTVKTFNIKTKDENGYLVNTPLKVVKAEYVMHDGTRKEAVLSSTSIYNTDNEGTRIITDNAENVLYNTLYIRPQNAKDVIIAEDENVDILITFSIDKERLNNEDYIILGEKINVAEISAYSTYHKNEEGAYYAAALVDTDSNPGNFGEMYTLSGDKNVNSREYIDLFEDDTFKSGIEIMLESIHRERTLTGFAWDDARTNSVDSADGVQYIGNGKYSEEDIALEVAKKNQNGLNEEKDNAIKDMKVQLVEVISIPETDGTGNEERVYEETIVAHNSCSEMIVRTNENGEYKLQGYIPGNYIVKFCYGDDANLENMLIFNGQDYKSTTYQVGQTEYAEEKENTDEVLEMLEKSNLSDAKDDEIKRLETISYSETMTNKLNTILKGKQSSNKTELVSNTNMESETAEFLVRAEKEKSTKTKLNFVETMDKIMQADIYVRHSIENIDFGIEYRPEVQVSLNKYIANIQVKTSDANGNNTTQALLDAKFKEYYGIVVTTDTVSGATEFLTGIDGEIVKVDRNATNADVEKAVKAAKADLDKCQKSDDGLYIVTLAGTELDTVSSVGLENLQYVENLYDKDFAGNLFLYDSNGYVKATQGFAYLNIDDAIMQGASISIKYLFAGNNLSEVDRVSSNLYELRFEDSPAKTAINKLFNEYYRYELNEDGTIKKDSEGNDIVYRIQDKEISDTGYYGRYLGLLYYTGEIGAKDVVAELKIDKILDYVDNDLVFNNSENKGVNNLWKTTTSEELLVSGLVTKDAFKDEGLSDNRNRLYQTEEKSNLAILVSEPTVNKDISKYLTPRYANGKDSFGTVNLVASKVISAEDITEDLNYQNIAEIVQYTSLTGRITNISTTLGNVKFFEGSNTVGEWDEARKESDTGATEQITLTPPTGLGKTEQIIRNTVEGASYTVIGIIAISLVCVGVLVGKKIYRKRRIK